MIETTFTDYSAAAPTTNNTPTGAVKPRSPIPLADPDTLQTCWRNSPILRNETYLHLKKDEIDDWDFHPLRAIDKDFDRGGLPNYKRMELNNRGMWKAYGGDEIKSRKHAQDNWYRRHAICTQLELTEWQTKRVMMFANTKAYKQVSNGYSLDLVTYCLCGLVCSNDDRSTHPNKKERDEIFERIEASLNLTNSPIPSVWNKLDRELSF